MALFLESYHAIVYGRQRLASQAEVEFLADVGSNKTSGTRDIRFGGIDRVAAADYRGWSAHVGAGISRRFEAGAATTLTPSLRADYSTVRDNGYTETGAGALSLKVNRQSTDELLIFSGGKLSHALTEAATLSATLGIGYDVLSRKSSITSAFVGGGAAFSTEGSRASPWLTRGGLAVRVNQINGLEIAAGVDIEARRGFTHQTASVQLRLPL
jgi:outer membrane autotransporter protein